MAAAWYKYHADGTTADKRAVEQFSRARHRHNSKEKKKKNCLRRAYTYLAYSVATIWWVGWNVFTQIKIKWNASKIVPRKSFNKLNNKPIKMLLNVILEPLGTMRICYIIVRLCFQCQRMGESVWRQKRWRKHNFKLLATFSSVVLFFHIWFDTAASESAHFHAKSIKFDSAKTQNHAFIMTLLFAIWIGSFRSLFADASVALICCLFNLNVCVLNKELRNFTTTSLPFIVPSTPCKIIMWNSIFEM